MHWKDTQVPVKSRWAHQGVADEYSPRCGANSVRRVTVLRGKYFVEFVVVTGGVTVIFQNPDFVVVDFVVVTSWWI